VKVLIAVDDSTCSEAVVDSAVKRNWPEHTEFLILTVLEPIALDIANQKDMQALIEEGTEKRRTSAKELVKTVSDKLKKQFSAHSGAVEFTVKEGSPKKEIVESAIEFGADRILIGAQGHGTSAHNLLGEVSRVVAATAPCSVEIIRETVSR
jgi:nucleotide-binding universal stress UspA family protein